METGTSSHTILLCWRSPDLLGPSIFNIGILNDASIRTRLSETVSTLIGSIEMTEVHTEREFYLCSKQQ